MYKQTYVEVNCCGQYALFLTALLVNVLNFRWRKKEPHDIVIECKKLSLDPIDRIQEKGGFMSSWASKQNCQDIFADKSISSILTGSCDSQGPEISRSKERRMSDSATQTGKSLQSGDSGTDSCSLPVMSSDEISADWSPTEVCGLSTPPSSQMSPSTSNPDLLLSCNIQSHCSTPAAVYTPGQSPTTSLGGDVAGCHQGYSGSPSVTGSRGKTNTSGWMHRSHEGQLSRALYSALAQHSSESAPAAIGGHQTSTPKEPVKCDNDKIEETPHHDGCNSLTSPSNSELSTFEIKDEQTKEKVTGTSEEQFDSSNMNVSPKEEYRDFSGQETSFVSESDEHKVKSFESHKDAISSEFLSDSLTPVGCQSLQSVDAVTLSNTPSDFMNGSSNDCMSIEAEESGIHVSQPCYDSESSSLSKEHHEKPSDAELENKLLEVNNSETSITSDEVLTDVSKFRSTTSAVHQNHYPAHNCDLLAAFPQLLPSFQSEKEHSGHSSIVDGDDVTSSRLQQQLCGASPVEILDNYLKTGNSVHCGELSR